MQTNSNRPYFGSRERKKEAEVPSFKHQCTIQPPIQCYRAYNRITNYHQPNFNSTGNSGMHILHCAAADEENIRPGLEMPFDLDENIKLNSSDSFVINFDNISEPSTSDSMDLYELYTSIPFVEEFQQNILQESAAVNQNSSNHLREVNVDMLHHTSSFNNHHTSSNNDDSDSDSVTQNNEETNTENPSSNSTSGNQSLEKIFNKYIPFITFLSFKAIYDHREGILIFVGLFVTFIHANSIVKREISKQSRRSFLSLGIISFNLFVSTCFIYFVFQDQQLYKNLIFIPPHSSPVNIWDVLWIVGITDFVLKFITIQLKVGMACFPAKLLPYSTRGKYYLTLERASQLYRSLVPIQPWLYYLIEIYQGAENSVGMAFLIAYMISKGSDIMSKVKLFFEAFLKLFQRTSVGTRPSNEQLISAGSQCPICHDEFNSPIILQCRHVFCESCVSRWFDREQTCPLCRAKIADDPSWKDGATSFFTQLF